MLRKNSGIKNFQAKEGEASRFCRNFFHLTGPKKLRQGTILCFRKFLVGKNILWIRGGYHDFLSKFSCLVVPKNFVGEPFSVSLISGIERFYASESYVTIFCRNFFVSQCRKISYRNPSDLCFRKCPVAKKFMDKRGGGIKIFRRKFLVSQCRKIWWASLQCFGKFGVSKKFMHNGGYHNFPSKIFCLTVPKNFVKEPFSVSLISGIKKC